MKKPDYAIHELLKNLAGGRVYFGAAPPLTQNPCIVIRFNQGDRWRSLDGSTGMAQASFIIDSYAEDYYSARDLGEDVEEILDGYRATVYYGTDSPQASVRIAAISITDEEALVETTEEPLVYRIIQTYLVTFEQ